MSAPVLAGWAIDALIASALLMAAVLLVRGRVRRAFGAQIAYALWALPVLRLLLPPLPAGWWKTEAAAPITRAGETITILIEPVVRTAAPVSGASAGTVIAFAWAVGAALFLGWHLIRHHRFCRAVVSSGEPVEQRGDVRVIASAAAPGPLAFGIWRRYVAFPRDFAERYDADERALALAHELGHHARRDLLANWVALLVLALHWFNPLAWRAFRAFRADQELANDARVIAACDAAERHAYGRAIVKAAHGGAISAACHLHTIADLKGRLRMLATSRASRRRLAAGAASVTLLVAGGLGLTASSSAAEQIRVSLKAPIAAVAPVALAQEPVPPAPPATGDRPSNVRRVIVVRDGVTHRYEGADADAYLAEHPMPRPPHPPVPPVPGQPVVPPMPPIPEVSSANCGGDGPNVEHSDHDGRHRIVICTNRIERAAARGAEMAANAGRIEREARAHALAGLERARASIASDRNLSEEARRDALQGVDEALAELRSGRD